MEKQKNYFTLTNLIIRAIEKLRIEQFCQIQARLEDFICRCSGVNKAGNLYCAALAKKYYLSAVRLKHQVKRDLNEFSYQFLQFKDFINADIIAEPKFSAVYEELLQIKQEYGEFDFDLHEKTISVITDDITLEDIYLGSFEIKLFIDNIPVMHKNRPYKVIALDPNPAGSNELVTHPHVSDEFLCEGDGHGPISRALEQGRLNDFFTVVISILNTYNPDSPYVALSEWEGISCYDCGYTMSGDDNYYCEFCCNDYCGQCSTYCQRCDQTICLGCSYECIGCHEPVCTHCTGQCRECEREFCKNCLTQESLCDQCDQIRKDQQDEDNQTDIEVQSHSVGQVDIHA